MDLFLGIKFIIDDAHDLLRFMICLFQHCQLISNGLFIGSYRFFVREIFVERRKFVENLIGKVTISRRLFDLSGGII